MSPHPVASSTPSRKRLRPDVSADDLRGLPEKEATILSRWCGIGRDVQTLDEIGSLLGVTRQRVAQVKDRALERLRRQRLARERAALCQGKSA